jgi:hypothetical protein
MKIENVNFDFHGQLVGPTLVFVGDNSSCEALFCDTRQSLYLVIDPKVFYPSAMADDDIFWNPYLCSLQQPMPFLCGRRWPSQFAARALDKEFVNDLPYAECGQIKCYQCYSTIFCRSLTGRAKTFFPRGYCSVPGYTTKPLLQDRSS